MLTLKIFVSTVVTFFLSFFLFVSPGSCDAFSTTYEIEKQISIENQHNIRHHTRFGSWRQRGYPTPRRVNQLSRSALLRQEDIYTHAEEILLYYEEANNTNRNPLERVMMLRRVVRLDQEFRAKRYRANRTLADFTNEVL